jgi:hypothetical protein
MNYVNHFAENPHSEESTSDGSNVLHRQISLLGGVQLGGAYGY